MSIITTRTSTTETILSVEETTARTTTSTTKATTMSPATTTTPMANMSQVCFISIAITVIISMVIVV